jgi:hypothetical protein
MILGFLWYGPIFGKQWAGMMGWSQADMAKMKMEGQGKTMKSYGIMAVGSLIMAYVMSQLIVFAVTSLGFSGISAGLQVGIWGWIGFIAPVLLGSVLWEGKSWKLWVLNAGYYLVLLVVMGIILGMWM